jgi:hypothetical protein
MASSAGNALPLTKAVLDLGGERRTGVLDVTADGARTRIYFEDGKPLFAEDGAAGEPFGRLLVGQGLISADQLGRVIEEMTRAATGDDPLRFGDAAVRLGVLTREQLERALAEQVCGIINRSLRRAEPQWSFQPSPEAAKPPRSLSLDLALDIEMKGGPQDVVVVVAAGSRAPDRVPAAEQAFQKGVALLRAAQTAPAAIELRRASDLQPDSLRYQLYATWAETRRRGDVPSHPDQQKLLDIAHRARKADPTFAFATYVIGQASMWAGDDATAKRWFYEALRLDPTSEAGTQVRILARRTGSSGMSGLWKLPDAVPPAADPAEKPAVPPVSKGPPPVPAAARVKRPSAAPPNRWAERLVPVVVAVATVGLVTVFVARRPGPRAGMAPSALPQPAPASAVPPVALEPHAPPPPPDGPGAGALAGDPDPEIKATKSLKEKAPDDGARGTVLLPARASGHRIFVDGRRAETDGTAPLRLLCGPHVIQIGGHGTPEHIDLPCRGEVQLE